MPNDAMMTTLLGPSFVPLVEQPRDVAANQAEPIDADARQLHSVLQRMTPSALERHAIFYANANSVLLYTAAAI